MKYLLIAVMTFFVNVAYSAPTTVQVMWPFSVASSQASMIRELLDHANKTQSKYKFIFVSKPGAGGTIAAKSVTDTNDQLTLLASTSSFYIRPLLYKESHSIDDFNIVSVICKSQPLTIYSKKYSKLSDIKGNSITVGVNPGSITSFVTRVLSQQNLNIIEVPYKGTPEATNDMIGGHIDGSVDFAGKSSTSKFATDSQVHSIGITGNKNINKYISFKNQGISGLENVTNDYIIFVDKSVDLRTRTELNSILNSAINEKVVTTCENEFGTISKIDITNSNDLHKTNKKNWTDLTKNITMK